LAPVDPLRLCSLDHDQTRHIESRMASLSAFETQLHRYLEEDAAETGLGWRFGVGAGAGTSRRGQLPVARSATGLLGIAFRPNSPGHPAPIAHLTRPIEEFARIGLLVTRKSGITSRNEGCLYSDQRAAGGIADSGSRLTRGTIGMYRGLLGDYWCRDYWCQFFFQRGLLGGLLVSVLFSGDY